MAAFLLPGRDSRDTLSDIRYRHSPDGGPPARRMADLRFLPDIDALVAPLGDDAPGGSKVVFRTLRCGVEEMRKDEDPSRYSDTDPGRPKEYKPADWAGVLRACLPALREQAKDLQIARWVVDALPRREEVERGKSRWGPGSPPPAAFAALADGLTLLRRLTADGWEYLLPPLDPDELDSRNASYNWLGDDNEGAALPQLVRSLPLAVTAAGVVSQHAWADPKGDRAAVEKAVAAADVDHLRAVLADLDRGRTELAGLLTFLGDRLQRPKPDDPTEVEHLAPGMGGLKAALDDCHELARGMIQQKTGGDPVAVAASADAPAGGGPVALSAAPAAPAISREAAYQQLRQAAELLRKLEPHSPVPFLVMRAVDLGGKPFPEMIRSFVRNEEMMAEIRRELNILDTPAD